MAVATAFSLGGDDGIYMYVVYLGRLVHHHFLFSIYRFRGQNLELRMPWQTPLPGMLHTHTSITERPNPGSLISSFYFYFADHFSDLILMASRKNHQPSEMDQEKARILFDQGAMFLLLNFPEGSEFGIDNYSWTVGPKFRGIKMIPPGIHFIYYRYANLSFLY